ncbi:MAG: flagellin, partial [Planctomycetes bacterium]|nr:flagellin [Planctomycetota bacterium]
MGLTVTNTNTFQLLSILNRTAKAQSNVITQLSTGLRINRGADDPAGLIALMSLRAE